MMAPTSNAVTNLSPAGVFEPLRPFVVLPDALEDAKWHGGVELWAETRDHFTLLTAMTAERAPLVNWSLSQEGQEAYAREGQTVSRRVDVAPQVAEGMARGAPDWNNLDRYARTNEWQGLPLVDRVTDLAKEVRP